ncbi:EpsG family protein [Candidatus Saccharibacteria bacterium]|nr:EpsG family protein [Candidatus Saccharibacteria bacterium]
MELGFFTSIALYLSVFLASGFLMYVGEKKKRYSLIILSLLLPALLAGLRLNTGTDSVTYRTFYLDLTSEGFDVSMSRIKDGTMEPFIVFLSRFSGFLHLGVNFVFFVFALITVVFLYLATRKFSKKHSWLYYLVLLLVAFPDSFNIMRQLAAVAVQAFTLGYIYNNQNEGKKTNLLLVLVLIFSSTMLHYSSALLIPMLFLPFLIKHIRGRSLYCVLSITAIACVCIFPSILSFVSSIGLLSLKHISTLMGTPGSIINIKFAACLALTVIYLINYLRSNSRRDKFFCFLMLSGVLYSAVGFYSGYVGRLANFFWIFIVFAAVDLLGQLTNKKYSRIIISVLLGVLYFVVYYGILGFDAVIPYSVAI